ncbi:hypothetical protein ABZ871_21810 [Streptomyces populi]
MISVYVSPEVEAALGTETAGNVSRAIAASGATCELCQGVMTDGGVNVAIAQGLKVRSIMCAHATCAPSEVVPYPELLMGGLVASASGPPLFVDASMSSLGPVLIFEGEAEAGTGTGDPVSPFLLRLLDQGLHMVSADLSVPVAPQWVAALHPLPTGLSVTILAPGSRKFFHGDVGCTTAKWYESALAERSLPLYLCEAGLGRGKHPAERGQAVVDAARSGRLVGARIACALATDLRQG